METTLETRRARRGANLTILHVAAPAEVGGLESVLRLLAPGHQRMGHRVVVAGVVPPEAESHAFLDALAGSGIEAVALRHATRDYGGERRAIRRLCDEIQPSLVHTHGYRPDVVDAQAARAAGVPTVSTVHGFTGGGLRNRLYEWIQEGALRRFAAVVPVSGAIAERLARRGVSRERLHVIPNAFDAAAPTADRGAARAALGWRDGEFVAGWVGRLSREKGPDLMVDAAALVAEPAVRLSVLGDGPMRGELERRAASLGLRDRIRWHGVVPEARVLFSAFDVLVLSSRTEGIPIVLLEAMAAGTPIVAASVGGVPEMLSSREALLVTPGEAAALARAIEAVRSDPGAARERSLAARRRLERDFGLEPWLARYEALYRSVAAQAETRAASRRER